jgi:CheY-like chemotaxis protein
MMPNHTIAIISVYQENMTLLDSLLRGTGYQTIVWADPYRAYPMIHRAPPDLILLDLWPKYPAMGAMLLTLLHLDPAVRHLPVLVCATDPHILRDAALPPSQPLVEVVLKPFDRDTVRLRVQRCIEASQARFDTNTQQASATV